MPALSECPSCGLDLGPYVETHCPRCGINLTPKAPITFGIRLLDLLIAICGTLLVFALMFVFSSYMNTSQRADLYRDAPYRATTFRVAEIYYARRINGIDGAKYSETIAYAIGTVDGHRESMDLLPYIVPRDQQQLKDMFPDGTVIPVYLFPTLRGLNRIQRIGPVPSAELYQRQVIPVTNHGLPVTGLIGATTALLSLLRFSLSRTTRSL